MRHAAILLAVQAACMAPEPPPRLHGDLALDDLIRLCIAWDAAYARLRETGDAIALEPATVQEAEMICEGIAEPLP